MSRPSPAMVRTAHSDHVNHNHGHRNPAKSPLSPPRLAQAALVASAAVLLAVVALHLSRAEQRRQRVAAETNLTAALDAAIAQRFAQADAFIAQSIAASSFAEEPPSPTFAFANPHPQQPAAVSPEAAAAAAAAVARGDVVLRASHRGPRLLCAYSEEELRGLLALRHGCWLGEARYFYAGVWLTWQALFEEFERPRDLLLGGGAEEEAECVLACKFHVDLHCSDEVPCVHAFHLRRNTTDTLVLRQLYEWGEYSFLKPSFHVASILDAGANIGIASVLFATMFPQATVVAVEASSRNFRSLRLNAQPYPNIIPVNAALWPRTASLALVVGSRNPDKPPEWGYMVRETSELSPGQAVEDSLAGVSIPFLVRAFGIPSFDFLKIDIEGSEVELFREGEENLQWVDAAKLVALELHGDMVPGSNETVLDFFARKENYIHQKDWSGEYEVFLRKDSNLDDK